MKVEKRIELKRLMSEMTLGLEVEQVGLTRWADRTAFTLTQINQQFTGRERWEVKTDGSINEPGCEFVSGIMNYSSMDKIQESVRMIRRAGGRTHISCGIHVHVDGARFLRDPKALIRLIKIVDRYEKHMYHALRADDLTEGQDRTVLRLPDGGIGWSRPVCQDFLERVSALKNPTIDQIRNEWYKLDGGGPWQRYNRSRYRLLNLHALWTKGTIEFRCFNSTLHAGKIKAYMQLSSMICAQALINKKATKGKRNFEPSKAHYEVRTWLLKLGAIGEEFKTMRGHLTGHLEGNASWHR